MNISFATFTFHSLKRVAPTVNITNAQEFVEHRKRNVFKLFKTPFGKIQMEYSGVAQDIIIKQENY